MLDGSFLCVGIYQNEFKIFDSSLFIRLISRGILFSSRCGSASFCFLLPELLGLLGSLWGSIASVIKNTPCSLRRWVSPLQLGHLDLRAPPPWREVAGYGSPGLCVPSATYLQ